jgi:c(7)-type cytochrome triheme protein
MKIVAALLAMIVAAGGLGLAQAVPSGFALEFDGEGMGAVTFSGTTHAEAGLRCADCHLSAFDVSRSARIRREDHQTDQFCFGCHDGDRAFGVRRNCDSCHEDG